MRLYYLFDPLCGWCYGANPAIRHLAKSHDIVLMPTGLFANKGRLMTADFARHAWHNDSKIMSMTGQPFSKQYRKQVLGEQGRFDSLAMTTALTAIAKIQPERELDALSVFYVARYVDGNNTSEPDVLAQVLTSIHLDSIVPLLYDQDTINATHQRMTDGANLAWSLGVSGVPQLAMQTDDGIRLLDNQQLYQQAPTIT